MRCLLSLSVLLSVNPAKAEESFHDRLSSGEVIVEKALIDGDRIPELTARGVIEAPVERVWAIIEDCGNYDLTMLRVSRSAELSRQGELVVCEVEIDMPFPLSNLVGVTQATHRVGPPEWSRSWSLLRGDYEVNDGSWTLTQFDGDPMRTLAVYRVHVEPKTHVPSAFLGMAQKKAIPRLFEKLREDSPTEQLESG